MGTRVKRDKWYDGKELHECGRSNMSNNEVMASPDVIISIIIMSG